MAIPLIRCRTDCLQQTTTPVDEQPSIQANPRTRRALPDPNRLRIGAVVTAGQVPR